MFCSLLLSGDSVCYEKTDVISVIFGSRHAHYVIVFTVYGFHFSIESVELFVNSVGATFEILKMNAYRSCSGRSCILRNIINVSFREECSFFHYRSTPFFGNNFFFTPPETYGFPQTYCSVFTFGNQHMRKK